MLTDKQKADKLREAVALLMDVDALQQAALGDSDVSYDNHNRILDIVEDFVVDIMELEAV